jgi:hypothetical protein
MVIGLVDQKLLSREFLEINFLSYQANCVTPDWTLLYWALMKQVYKCVSKITNTGAPKSSKLYQEQKVSFSELQMSSEFYIQRPWTIPSP